MSRGNNLRISIEDLRRAREWLLQAEFHMPDIFREMVGRSDNQVINDLHFFMFSRWATNGHQAIHKSTLIHFLQTKLPVERIDKVLQIAESSNMIAHVAGKPEFFIPRPRSEHGLE